MADDVGTLIQAARWRVRDLRVMVEDAVEPGHRAELQRRLDRAEAELRALLRGATK